MYLRMLGVTMAVAFFISGFAQEKLEHLRINDTLQFKKGIARTSWLLTSSSPSRRKEVRILVYGQSISVQEWWKEVETFLEKSYPNANVIFINKAIGGFSSDKLKLTVANDVVSFYPDLMLFHDYGGEADYETIIRIIRQKTTAEIAIQTDHMAMQGQQWHDQHNNVWLPNLCMRYGLALIDVRTAWKEYLKQNNLQIQDLLKDGVHLNAEGNELMAAIIKQYFKSISPQEYKETSVKTLTVGKDFYIKGDKIIIPISGNRIDLVWKKKASNKSSIHVRIDNKNPISCGCCFYYTRPAFDTNDFFLRRIGQLLAMDLGDKIKQEQWLLKILSVDSVTQQISYSLHGSLTGDDGEGRSDSVFKSRSGKITIQPAYWFRRRNKGDFAQFRWLQKGDVLYWNTKPMCSDEAHPNAGEATTIAQGLVNEKHTLELKGTASADINQIIIYQPPLK